MLVDQIIKFSKKVDSRFNFNYDLKQSNWFNIGGKTKVYFKPDSLSDLVFFLKEFGTKEQIYILGAGSNILISDETFDGTVIKLGKKFSNISLLPNDIIVAGSACTDKKLSEFALDNSLSGLEFLACIPGTIGGGLKMNAGCFKREFKDILISIQAINRTGEVITIPADRIKFEYRKNNLSDDLIFLSASFKGKKNDQNHIKQEMIELKKTKEASQPNKVKTSGSTFKNPTEQTKKKVWELIKESVSLDLQFGDAAISRKHCNFFINKNNASFSDMNKLIEFVRESVEKKTGIKLEKEIKILK
jgi:UDP-N-acetylmuramate dehydrogenase